VNAGGLFVERVRRLVAPEPSRPTTVSRAAPWTTSDGAAHCKAPSKRVLQALAALAVIGALAYFAIDNFLGRKQPHRRRPLFLPARVRRAFPRHRISIAVLPFVNFSGDKEQEYFSEALRRNFSAR